MRFKEILHESQADIVSNLISDMKSGDINPSVTKAILNYVSKQTNGTVNPEDDPKPDAVNKTPAPAATVPPPATNTPPPAAQPQAVTPISTIKPGSEPVKEAKVVRFASPAGVNLSPDDLGKILREGGFTTDKINDIVTFAYKQTIFENCKILAAKKYYKEDAADIIADMFMKIPGTFRQRTHLSHVLITTGVLDLKKLLVPGGKGTLIDLILPKYKTDPGVIALKNRLKNMSSLPAQNTAASKGAGEDLITILGSPVQKLSPGDLSIEGKELEIKAQGARLKGFEGAKSYGNTLKIYSEWAYLLSEALGNDGIAVLASYGYNLGKYFHMGLERLEALSEAIKASKVKNKGALVHKAFALFFETLYVQSNTATRETVMRSFDHKGNFTPKTFRENWLLLSYDYYIATNKNKEKGTELYGVMFYHQWDETYFIVTNRKQIEKNIDNFEIGTDMYNWTSPNNQVPKVTYGKELKFKSQKSKDTAKAKAAAIKAAK
jgi:hypothetical protein